MKVIYKGKSRALMNFSATGQRSILACETRIRRKAKRLGLYAKHRSSGWSLLSEKYGEPLAERMFDWQLEDKLNALLRQPRPAKVEAVVSSPLTLREMIAQAAHYMEVRRDLVRQHAERPSMSARLRQLLGAHAPAVKVLLGHTTLTAGAMQRSI